MVNIDALTPQAERVQEDLQELAEIRDPDHGGWTRMVFSPSYRQSREWVKAKMSAAGLNIYVDGAGNLVGVLPGHNPSAPAVMTGSHTDTVETGGRFDGVVGVLGSLEVVRQLREHDVTLDRDLLVVDFLGEESNDYGLSCLGSRALAGEFTAHHLDRVDQDGVRLGERFAAFGIEPSGVLEAASKSPARNLHRYLELHIEQGSSLEERSVSIGVVTAIAAISRLVATFVGRADHAGTRPMHDRRDAMVAAAEAVLAVRQEGCGAPVHGVATTSRLDSRPGAPNVVPSMVQMYGELRSVDVDWLSDAQRRLTAQITAKAGEYGVDADVAWSVDNDCRPTSASVHEAISTSADALGIPWEPVPSGATHDAVHIARLCPMGMIFVPSRDGRSHCPDEWTDLEDIVTGIRVHAATLVALDRAQ